MISAVSGNSALALLSMFGRSQPASGAEAAPVQRPPSPPPPPPSQGDGASAKSIFDALVTGSSTPLEDLVTQMVASLDANGDGKLGADELSAGFKNAVSGDEDDAGLPQMVSDILSTLDTDGDKAIGAGELTSGLQQLAANGPQPGGAATNLVSRLDTNGDGLLGADALAAGFQARGPSDGAQKSLQELLFGLLLDQKGQTRTAQAAALYAA